MLTRRDFLKGLLSSVAAGALVKNGVLRPEQVIAEPERRVFDMAANTWRREWTTMVTVWDGRIGHTAVWNRKLTVEETAILSDIPPPWRTVWHVYERAVLKSAPVLYAGMFDGCNYHRALLKGESNAEINHSGN